MLEWRSTFELELGDVPPARVLRDARDTGRWRLQGLRVSVCGEEIRARYVVGEAAAASLLVARPVQRGECTYLVGEMHWAAMFVTLFVKGIAPALFGVGLLVWGLVDQTWQVVAFGAVLSLTLGWMSIDMLRTTGQDQAAEEGLIRESLREALVSWAIGSRADRGMCVHPAFACARPVPLPVRLADMDAAIDTAVLLTAQSLAWFTDRWRSQSVLPVDPPLALSDAIPPHFTLLSPWHLDPASDEASGRLREAPRSIAPFRLRFSSVGTFPTGHVYLQPEPSFELDALFAALTGAFPEFPPYGGAFSEWLPHLTVSRRGGEATARVVRSELGACGPLDLDVRDVSAWEYLPSGRWVRHVTAPLAG